MTQQEKQLSEKESLALITQMIDKAKDFYHDTGMGTIMWGAVIAICSMVKLSQLYFDYRLPFDIYLLTIVAIIPRIFLTIREKKERKVKAYDDAYMDYIWLGFGICIFLLIFITNIIFRLWEPVAIEYRVLTGHRSPFRFNEFISPLFLLLYGLPSFIILAACKFKPILWGGIFCWVYCLITVFTTVKIDLLLTAALAITAWFISGILMEREYNVYKMEQASINV